MLIFQVCPYLDFLSFAFGHHSPVEGGREISLFPLCGGEQNYEAGGPAQVREGTPRKLEAPDHITTAH